VGFEPSFLFGGECDQHVPLYHKAPLSEQAKKPDYSELMQRCRGFLGSRAACCLALRRAVEAMARLVPTLGRAC
jgi:hypothetical protein